MTEDPEVIKLYPGYQSTPILLILGVIEGVYVKLKVVIRLVLHELPKMQLRYGVVVTPPTLKNFNIAVVLLMYEPFRILPFSYFSNVLK